MAANLSMPACRDRAASGVCVACGLWWQGSFFAAMVYV